MVTNNHIGNYYDNDDTNDNNSNSDDNLWGLDQEHHCSSISLFSRLQ